MKVIALIPFKNEGWILPTYLSNVLPVVDEIIGIDDGSTDNCDLTLVLSLDKYTFGCDDIGVKDVNGNVIQGDVLTEETSNSYINANHHMVVAIGLDNLVIVDTPNATPKTPSVCIQ